MRLSQSMRWAISSVSDWSLSFQPRRSATLRAMSEAPLPYSRSMVSIRIMNCSSMSHNLGASAGVVPSDDKGEQQHHARRDSQHHERVDVGQGLGLRFKRPVQAAVRLQFRVRGAYTGMRQLLGESIN